MGKLSEDNSHSSSTLTLQAGWCLTSAILLFLQLKYHHLSHDDMIQQRNTWQRPAFVSPCRVQHTDTCHVFSHITAAPSSIVPSNQPILWFTPRSQKWCATLRPFISKHHWLHPVSTAAKSAARLVYQENCSSTPTHTKEDVSVSTNRLVLSPCFSFPVHARKLLWTSPT